MKLIVQKYGGSSLNSIKKIKSIAKYVSNIRNKGYKIVVVVSAQGDTTDKLTNLAYKITKSPQKREVDMLLAIGELKACAILSLAINANNTKAISFSGGQSGIITNNNYNDAKIINIKPIRIKEALVKGYVVIVAGFQGVDNNHNVTTLGRGGSDLSAVALAYALKANRCELYKDVNGIYTANPKLVNTHNTLKKISYEEMMEMSYLGAQVINTRALGFAQKYNIPLYVYSSMSYKLGTTITKEVSMLEKPLIKGVVANTNEAMITLRGINNKVNAQQKLFGAIAKKNINVDIIIQEINPKGNSINISFTIEKNHIRETKQTVNALKQTLGIKGLSIDSNIAKISLVGSGMIHTPGTAAKMFSALSENNIKIKLISTSEIRITCIVNKKNYKQAVKAVHNKFFS